MKVFDSDSCQLTGYIPVLDGLRGYAILMVMWSHFSHPVSGDGVLYWVNNIFKSGWVGVDLFFVLSGFLITRILLATKNHKNCLKNFYIRRTLRIFPLYYATIVVFFIFLPLIFPYFKNIIPAQEYQIWLWLYMTNFGVIYYGDFGVFSGNIIHTGHYWTLAIEEHFYLLWPLFVKMLSDYSLAILGFALMVVAFLSRLWIMKLGAFGEVGYDSVGPHILTFCRMDALISGGLLALSLKYFKFSKLDKAAFWGLFSCGIAIIKVFISQSGLPQAGARANMFTYNIYIIFFVSLIIISINYQDQRLFKAIFLNKFITFTGRISYGLYIFHGLISGFFLTVLTPDLVSDWIENKWIAYFSYGLIWMSVSYGMAFISWKYYETFFMKLKHKFV